MSIDKFHKREINGHRPERRMFLISPDEQSSTVFLHKMLAEWAERDKQAAQWKNIPHHKRSQSWRNQQIQLGKNAREEHRMERLVRSLEKTIKRVGWTIVLLFLVNIIKDIIMYMFAAKMLGI